MYRVGDHDYKDFNRAAGLAVKLADVTGEPVVIDVLIHSVEEARIYGGADAVKLYNEQPANTVIFKRFVIKVG